MKILNIIFQNVDSKLFFFRAQMKTSSKRQNRQTSFFKKRQSIQIDENYLRELQRQKKEQKNSNNKQIQKTTSNETDQQTTKKSYSKTTYQIDAMMILIINKNHAEQNVFDIFISKNITAAKACCRFISTFNKKK